MLTLLLYAQVLIYVKLAYSSVCPSSCHCLVVFVDCSSNNLHELPSDIPTSVQKLNLNNNKILKIKTGTFDRFSGLHELKLSRNLFSKLDKGSFNKLQSLRVLEINKNSFTQIDSLTFEGLKHLAELRLRHNALKSLQDGAFYGLDNLRILKLDNNSITHVTKKWIFGLKSLNKLILSFNSIVLIEEGSWESCANLHYLDLSHNELAQINHNTFDGLAKLKFLRLSNNKISSISEESFSTLPVLEVLELSHNNISWIIEDTTGTFLGLKELIKLDLSGNEITSVNQDAFLGLYKLKELNLQNNNIKTIQNNAFKRMNLSLLVLNSSGLICDCHIAWFIVWIQKESLNINNLKCAYPESLKGQILTDVPPSNLLCSQNESPKPVITAGPQSAVIVSGSQVNISCHATSSSNSSLVFKWRRNYDDVPSHFTLMFNNSTVLNFPNVSLSHAGNYQCIVSNKFGTAYSKKANLTVLVMPSLTKKPSNITVKAGSTARLECAAVGQPAPQVRWQKDGGTQFPAAQERRMHVMPTDDVFFIVNTKPSDSGLYSCIARNAAGTVVANSSLTVLEPPIFTKKTEDVTVLAGKPAVVDCMASGSPKPIINWWKDGISIQSSPRIVFAANNQLLIIITSLISDSGTYQCEIKNILGSEKRNVHLTISPYVYRQSDDDTTGIIIIAVVCCAVGTSAIWVIIIYHSQKRYKHREKLKSCGARLNHDTKSDISASSKDSGTGDSRRSNENLQFGSNVCLEDLNDTVGNGEAESPLMSTLALVIEEDAHCRDCCQISERQFSRFDKPVNKSPELSMNLHKSSFPSESMTNQVLSLQNSQAPCV